MISEHTQWFLVVGILLVSLASIRPFLKRFWITVPQLQLLCGLAIGPLALNLVSLDWTKDAKLLEVVAEVAVIISLYATGVKMREPLLSKTWIPPLILASFTMVATILMMTVTGILWMDLSLSAALLLGAVLAPTDPVLADEVQVEHAGDDHPLRRTLTGEAGFNDGTAFPFVLLAIGLSDPQLHALGENFWRWIAIDLVWKIVGGLVIGWCSGQLLGRLTLWFQHKESEEHGIDEIRSLGFIALTYGCALFLNTYAFLAVFAAAVGLRHVELQAAKGDGNERDADDLLREQSDVASALESLIQVLLVVVVGVLLSTTPLLNWKTWLFALVAIIIIRPLAVLLTLHTNMLSLRYKLLCAWFGIRGIGTLFYLAHAIVLGAASSLPEELSVVSACAVALELSFITQYCNEQISTVDASTDTRMLQNISNSLMTDEPAFLDDALFLRRRTDNNLCPELEGISELSQEWLRPNRVSISEAAVVVAAVREDLYPGAASLLTGLGWTALGETITLGYVDGVADIPLYAGFVPAGPVALLGEGVNDLSTVSIHPPPSHYFFFQDPAAFEPETLALLQTVAVPEPSISQPITTGVVIFTFLSVTFAHSAVAAPINGDFETDNVSGVDGWTPVLTGANSTIEQSSANPNGGSLHAEAYLISPSAQTGTAGMKQTNFSVVGGADYTLEVYARLPDGEVMQPNAPSYAGTSFVTAILWYNAGNFSLGQSYLFLTTELTDSYQLFDLAATAPATAVTADIMIYLQSGGIGGIEQTVWIDDVSFTAVPEPSGLLLVVSAACVLAFTRLRRR
ncbi:Na(+)/H(+) antiporter [Durusdinium trenchii]|uniref:Na(+)/H(+) antiporter n=1 Tax=Durusdinium trenchii TaxID=1381693 RepID=A0ABP0MMR1_9DINO